MCERLSIAMKEEGIKESHGLRRKASFTSLVIPSLISKKIFLWENGKKRTSNNLLKKNPRLKK